MPDSTKKFTINLFVFFSYVLIWYSIFRIAGTFTQGYNIYEDNQLITLTEKLDTNSILNVGSDLIYDNTFNRNRFTPVSEIHKLILVKLFKDNFTLYNIYLVLLGIFTSFILYRFCRICGFGIILSFIFGISILTGSSSITWSQIYYAEHFCLFILSLSLLCLAKSIFQNKQNTFYRYLFIFFLVLAFLCKETFILLVPAITFLFLQLYSIRFDISLKKSFFKNKFAVLTICFLSLAVLLLIILLVGVNNQGYAGLDLEKVFSISFVSDYLLAVFGNLFFLTGLAVLIINFLIRKKNMEFKSIDVLIAFTLLLLITFPQYILFYKSGMEGRYFIPFILGFSFFLIYSINPVYTSKFVRKSFKIILITIIFVSMVYEVQSKSIPQLSEFANYGKTTMRMINYIKENNSDTLLIVMDPAMNYHEVYSFEIYLNYLKSGKYYRYDFVKADYLSKYYSDPATYELFAGAATEKYGRDLIDSSKSNENIKLIFIFGGLDEKFIKKNTNWFKKSNFKKENIGNYTLYAK